MRAAEAEERWSYLAHVHVRHARRVRQVADDVAAGQLLGNVLSGAEHEVALEQAEARDRRVDGHQVGVQRHGDGQARARDSLGVQGQLDGDVVEANEQGVRCVLQPDLQLAVVAQVGGVQHARGLGEAAVLDQGAGAHGLGAERVQVEAAGGGGLDAAGNECALLRQAGQDVALCAVPVVGGEGGRPRRGGRRGGGAVEHEAGVVGRKVCASQWV